MPKIKIVPTSLLRLNQSGITVVELLVVVSIIAVLSGILVPSFTRYSESQNLRQAREKIKSDLRTAQNNAMTGSLSTTVDYWGVKFTNNNGTYSLFNSTNTTCSSVNIVSTFAPLAGGVVLRGNYPNGGCVFFSENIGDAFFSDTSEIMVGYSGSSGNSCLGLTVNSAGLIRDSATVACP